MPVVPLPVVTLLAVVLLASSAQAETVRPELLALALPSRRADAAQVAEHVRRTAARVARELAIPMADPAALGARLDLSARLREARTLAIGGALDEAAVILDDALEQGVRQLHLARPRELMDGHVLRISIALARGEDARAGQLLSRALAYDAGLTLEPGERTPQLAAALDRARATARKQAGAAAIGDACREHAVVVTGRVHVSDDPGAPLTLELFRFDDCVLVASVIAPAGDVERSAPLWSRPVAASVRTALAERAAAASRSRGRSSRAVRTVGIATGAVGLVLVAAGTYFAFDAAGKADDINDGCSPQAPCSGEVLRQRAEDVDDAQLAARLLWLGGGAAVTAGVLVYLTAGRGDREVPRARLSVSDRGVGFAWSGRF